MATNVPRYVFLGVVILLLTPVVLLGVFGNRADKQQVAALRQLAAETPLYPKFVQATSAEFDKLNYASLTITYTVPADNVALDDVRSFYTRELTSRGWQAQETRDAPVIDLGGDREGHVTFRKGDYRITLAPGKNNAEYYVTYKWGSL